MTPSPVKSILVLLKQFGLTLALGLFLLGSAAAANLHPVRGFLPDLRFSLQAAGPKTVTQDDFKDKVVMMFFGYASCPDICPTTLAQLGLVMEELGERCRAGAHHLCQCGPPPRYARLLGPLCGRL